MGIYISHLIETKELMPIINNYNLGLEIVQFGSGASLDDKERYNKDYKIELEKMNNPKEISFHGPFVDLVPGSRDSEIRKVTKSRFENAYTIAEAYKSKHIIYHSGFIPKTYGPKEWLDNNLEFWSEFIKENSGNMEVHIENVYEEDYILIADLIENINHPNFSMCLDIGHVNVNSSKSLEYWIKGLKDKIKHVHLHNNDGIRDYHYGLNKGTIDVINTLELLKINAPGANWTLEVMNVQELIESINILEKNGFLNK
jgi:sugar phosphate isomerase/epimerase